jgi:hypothetical protein
VNCSAKTTGSGYSTQIVESLVEKWVTVLQGVQKPTVISSLHKKSAVDFAVLVVKKVIKFN